MASHSDQSAGDVHFVVRFDGKLHITDDSYVYDPLAPGLTEEEVAAIKFLDHLLGHGDVALLDNSMLEKIQNNGWKFVPPHHP
jgi:hypothetical protein